MAAYEPPLRGTLRYLGGVLDSLPGGLKGTWEIPNQFRRDYATSRAIKKAAAAAAPPISIVRRAVQVPLLPEKRPFT